MPFSPYRRKSARSFWTGSVARQFPIDRRRLCESEEYVVQVMLPLFGGAMAPWAGQAAPAVVLCRAGMKAVFDYWYKNRMPCCTEPDLADAAFEVAELVAETMFPPDVVESAMSQLVVDVGPQPRGGCGPALAAY